MRLWNFQEDNFNLENKISIDLRSMEEEAAHLSGQIDVARATKRDALSEIVEVERQIMLWERKIMLEREMAEVRLHPGGGRGGRGRGAEQDWVQEEGGRGQRRRQSLRYRL